MALKQIIKKEKPKFNFEKSLSWSSVSSFTQYSKEDWYQHYYCGATTPITPQIAFGLKVGQSFETDKPLARVHKYSSMEHTIYTKSINGIPIMGKFDSYCNGIKEKYIVETSGKKKIIKLDDTFKRRLREYKTGAKWTQKDVDNHGQITFYCLVVYLTEKIRPEDIEIHLDWYPTKRNTKMKIDFVDDIDNNIVSFKTKRTLKQLLEFDNFLKKTYLEMQKYVENHP